MASLLWEDTLLSGARMRAHKQTAIEKIYKQQKLCKEYRKMDLYMCAKQLVVYNSISQIEAVKFPNCI